jgi:hypothetical protein
VLAVEALKDGVKITTIYMPLVKTPMMKSTTIYDAFPMRTAEHAASQLYPGSGDKKDQREPAAGDAAMFQKVFTAVTRRARRRDAGRQ